MVKHGQKQMQPQDQLSSCFAATLLLHGRGQDSVQALAGPPRGTLSGLFKVTPFCMLLAPNLDTRAPSPHTACVVLRGTQKPETLSSNGQWIPVTSPTEGPKDKRQAPESRGGLGPWRLKGVTKQPSEGAMVELRSGQRKKGQAALPSCSCPPQSSAFCPHHT